jgi:hypothetical protein
MTATISAQDAITAVHEAAQLGGDTGLTVLSIRAMTGLTGVDLSDALGANVARGTMSHIDGRWIAWPICPTCGWGLNDHLPEPAHPVPGVCETHPADRCAGYPLNTN